MAPPLRSKGGRRATLPGPRVFSDVLADVLAGANQAGTHMNLFDRVRRSRLLGLALTFSVLAPLTGLPVLFAQEASVPDIGSGAARTRRPWFGRQLGKLLT